VKNNPRRDPESIVTRTLRLALLHRVARELLIGRFHAMSTWSPLLSESQCRASVKGLFEARRIPHADDRGPPVPYPPPRGQRPRRPPQSLSLLFFELAFHSDEGFRWWAATPHIVAHLEVTARTRHHLSFISSLGRIQHHSSTPPPTLRA